MGRTRVVLLRRTAFTNRVDAVRGETEETEEEIEEERGAAATLAHTNAMRCRDHTQRWLRLIGTL